MTFRQLALSNVRGNAQRYAAFFLSSAFSVLIFFLYAQFIFHPDVTEGYIYGGSGVRSGMIACEVLIIVFSFFFVLYATSSFLRARHQEFGLLALLGTTRAQLRRLIWLESTVLSIAAIAVGMALGLLFSKLFLMAMSRLLMVESPIRFAILPEAVLITAVGFFALFQLITGLAVLGVGRQRVIDLLSAARRPKTPPRASVVLAALAAVAIGAGYAMALTVPVPVAFFPVIALVTVGTYLLFGQASVFVLRAVQNRPALVLRGPRLVVVAQLVFRIKDNARLLATVAILSAIVLTASGTFYVMARQFAMSNDAAHPQAFTAIEPGAAGQQAPNPAEVDALLAQSGVEPTVRVDVPGVVVPFRLADDAQDVVRRATLIAQSDYLDVVEQTQARLPTTPLAAGALRFVDPLSPQAVMSTAAPAPAEPATVALLPNAWFSPAGFEVTESSSGVLLTPLLASGPWIVASDEGFAAIAQAAPAEDEVRIYAVDWPNGFRTRDLNERIGAAVTAGQARYTADRYASWTQIRQTLGLTMFIGLFISLLFFIAAGSLIYFKLFTELQDDRQLFVSLERIGITSREVTDIVSVQMGLIFFLPFAVGAAHTLFALRALGSLVDVDVIGYALLVVGLFALVQGLFFLLTRWTYLRALRPAM